MTPKTRPWVCIDCYACWMHNKCMNQYKYDYPDHKYCANNVFSKH